MLSGLKIINCAPSEELERNLNLKNKGQVFVLRTCQRTLILGFNKVPEKILLNTLGQQSKKPEIFQGLEAYRFLLETICGLKSRILGENEIVHQFKESYSDFLKGERPNRHIQETLEKLFKDAKKVRTQHLKNIGLQTYAGIVRQVLGENFKAQSPLIILGSGSLAEDLIKICNRRYKIFVWARKQKRTQELCDTFNITSIPFDQCPFEAAKGYGPKEVALVNTIGTNEPLFSANSFKTLEELLKGGTSQLIDLGEPTPFSSTQFSTHFSEKSFMALQDIFKRGELLGSQKEDKVKKAKKAIKDASHHRQKTFLPYAPFGWEELQFA